MKTITIDGATFTCTLSERFRRHTADEIDVMRESIREHGVREPVKIYHDTDLNLDGCVLDGEGRLGLSAELGLEPRSKHLGKLSTEAAYELAKVYNDARRQDDPQEVRKRRVKRVAELRAEGKSIPVIAETEGVSIGQVQRDLEKAKDSGFIGGDKPEPAKVTGKGGKSQAAKKKPDAKKPGRKPKDEAEPKQTAEPEPAVAEDADEGVAFVGEVETLCRDMDQLAGRMKELKKSKYGYSIHVDSAVQQVEAARKTLWQGRPCESCPYCEANETDGCKTCNGTRRVKKATADRGREAVGK